MIELRDWRDGRIICSALNCEKQEVRNVLKQALAEAKKEAVRGFLGKILAFECKEMDCGECPEENDILCALNGTVRTYGIDRVIKEVEGI